jgi:hypothetical protein
MLQSLEWEEWEQLILGFDSNGKQYVLGIFVWCFFFARGLII